MTYNNTIFGQMLTFIKQLDFQKIVDEHHEGAKPRKFSHWAQLIAMLYCQLEAPDSIRDLVVKFNAQKGAHYHLNTVELKKSTLADANNQRSYKVFECLFYEFLSMYSKSKKHYNNFLYLIDSTTIDLCLSMYSWAKFRKTKGAIKMHTLYNYHEQVPEFILVTTGKCHDLFPGKSLAKKTPSGSTLVFDRAYNDFRWWYQMRKADKFVVSRMKKGVNYKVLCKRRVDPSLGLISDQLIVLTDSHDKYPEPLRLVTFYDAEKDKTYEFITNNKTIKAIEICELYKKRWAIELFFKWIKQHLKIKKFIGRSKNAVLIQIYTALLAYLLTRYIMELSKTKYPPLTVYRILVAHLFARVFIWDLLDPGRVKRDFKLKSAQLSLFKNCAGQ